MAKIKVVKNCFVTAGEKYIIKRYASSNPFSQFSAGDYIYLYDTSFNLVALRALSPGVNLGGGIWGLYAAVNLDGIQTWYDDGMYCHYYLSPGGSYNAYAVSYGNLPLFEDTDVVSTEPVYATIDCIAFNLDANTFFGEYINGATAIGFADEAQAVLAELYNATWDTSVFADGVTIQGATSGATANVSYQNNVAVGRSYDSVIGWFLKFSFGTFVNGETIFQVGSPGKTSTITDWTGTKCELMEVLFYTTLYAGVAGTQMAWGTDYKAPYDDLPAHSNLYLSPEQLTPPIVQTLNNGGTYLKAGFSATPLSGVSPLKTQFTNESKEYEVG